MRPTRNLRSIRTSFSWRPSLDLARRLTRQERTGNRVPGTAPNPTRLHRRDPDFTMGITEQLVGHAQPEDRAGGTDEGKSKLPDAGSGGRGRGSLRSGGYWERPSFEPPHPTLFRGIEDRFRPPPGGRGQSVPLTPQCISPTTIANLRRSDLYAAPDTGVEGRGRSRGSGKKGGGSRDEARNRGGSGRGRALTRAGGRSRALAKARGVWRGFRGGLDQPEDRAWSRYRGDAEAARIRRPTRQPPFRNQWVKERDTSAGREGVPLHGISGLHEFLPGWPSFI